MNTTLLRPRQAVTLAVVAVLALAPALASAQAIYRIVGPDGRVTFSDKPPTNAAKTTTLGPGGRSADSGAAGNLPFELREISNRYPVTLYTQESCIPCDAARNLLKSRGVPYTERTINTDRDIDALKRMGLELTLPYGTIGNQRLKGYAEQEWNEYLDAAGYPRTSRLPSGYRNPPPAPLAPAQETPAQAQRAPAPVPEQPVAPPPGPTPDNPSGLVF